MNRTNPYAHSGFQYARAGESRAQFLHRVVRYKPTQKRFLQATEQPSRFISSVEGFQRELKSRIFKTGFSKTIYAERFGLSFGNWTYLTNHPDFVRRMGEAFTQSVAAFFNIRYVQFSFTGPLLQTVDDIIQDLEQRCVTAGINLETDDFEVYTGIDYMEFVNDLKAHGVTAWNYHVLVNHLCMRVLPPVEYKPVCESRYQEFCRNVMQIKSTLGLTYDELGEMIGRSGGVVQQTLSDTNWKSDVAKELAKALGMPCLQPNDLKNPKQYFYLDLDLWDEIIARIDELGWKYVDVAKTLYPDYTDARLTIIRDSLANADSEINALLNEDVIRKLCDMLAINLHNPETVPTVYLSWLEGASQRDYLQQAGLLISTSRMTFRFSIERMLMELRHRFLQARGSKSRVRQIEKGTQSQRLFFATYCLLRLFQIEAELTPPYSQFPIKELKTPKSLKEIKELVKERYKSSFFGLDTLVELTGCTKSDASNVIKANKAIEAEVTFSILRLLNIQLDSDSYAQEFFQLESWFQEHGFSPVQICQRAGVSLYDYYRLKCGSLLLSSSVGQKITGLKLSLSE